MIFDITSKNDQYSSISNNIDNKILAGTSNYLYELVYGVRGAYFLLFNLNSNCIVFLLKYTPPT